MPDRPIRPGQKDGSPLFPQDPVMAMPSSTNPAINDHRAGQRRPPSDLPWTTITSRRPARTEIHLDHEAPVHLQQSKLQRKIQLQIHSCRRQQASAQWPPTIEPITMVASTSPSSTEQLAVQQFVQHAPSASARSDAI
ncbi:hypothetical protein ACLOJK_027097 [Asimina triloba]